MNRSPMCLKQKSQTKLSYKFTEIQEVVNSIELLNNMLRTKLRTFKSLSVKP